jgi:hypothetical protein
MLKHIGVDTVGIAMYLQVIYMGLSDRNANQEAGRDIKRSGMAALFPTTGSWPAKIPGKHGRETYFSMFPAGFHLFYTTASIPSVERSRYYRTRRCLFVHFVWFYMWSSVKYANTIG